MLSMPRYALHKSKDEYLRQVGDYPFVNKRISLINKVPGFLNRNWCRNKSRVSMNSLPAAKPELGYEKSFSLLI